MINPELHTRLEIAGLETLYQELVAIAMSFSKAIARDQDRGLGKTAEDIVQDVLHKLLDDQRHWDPNKTDLRTWLIGNIKSEVHNHYFRVQNRVERAALSLDDPLSETGEGEDTYGDVTADIRIVEDSVVVQEDEARVRKLYNDILDETADPELSQLISAIMDGCHPKAESLAEELSLPIEQIYNLKRKLKRQLLKRGFA